MTGLSNLFTSTILRPMNLGELRAELEMTHEQIAEAVGVTRVAWTQWENGSRPSVDNAWKIIELAESYSIRLKLEDIFPRDGN